MLRGFINAKIFGSDATAFLLEDGVFKSVGTNKEIESALSPQEECVDLNGGFVIPGFVDSHMHLAEYGQY
ncbi:MAG: amidohydrolase, partial [Erysipelotrichia bacterium]|nr:amidohydrolase [Erysipelotrichia bacterium]